MTRKIFALEAKDILPSDPVTTLWRLCAANGWSFVPDFFGGEPFVDIECAAHLLGITKKTLQNDYLDGVPKYGNGVVKLSELMRLRRDSEEKP